MSDMGWDPPEPEYDPDPDMLYDTERQRKLDALSDEALAARGIKVIIADPNFSHRREPCSQPI